MTEEHETSKGMEAYAELSMTEFGPVPKVGLKLIYTRKQRAERFVDTVLEESGCTRAELSKRLSSDDGEELLDVFHAALERSVGEADEVYSDALARLVAGALDDAKIDEAGFVLSEVLKLEPVHLRAMLELLEFHDESGLADPPEVTRGPGSAVRWC